MDLRARMMLDALNMSSAPQQPPQQPPTQQMQQPTMQPQQMQQPQRFATGGPVGLPTLQELANPNFDFSSMGTFAPMTQNVPLFVADSPAYGNMGQDVFDFKAPTARAAPQPYTTVNQPVATTRNRRVPTQTATVNLPMPGVATPPPNVPTDTYMPTMPGTETVTPGMPIPGTTPPVVETPSAPPVTSVATEPVFTPTATPMGPDPFEVRRSEAAAELDAFNKRQAELAAQEAEAKRVADAAAADAAKQAADAAKKAEEKRLADKLFSDTQQQEATRVAQEQQRIQNEVNARLAAEEAERKRIADAAASKKAEVDQFLASAPRQYYGTYFAGEGSGESPSSSYHGEIVSLEDIRKSGVMPTVQSGGEGRFFEKIYGPGGDAGDSYFMPYEDPSSSWYSGDGGGV